MKYVMGIDLGTSGVKAILVDENGKVCGEATKPYRLIQHKPGYCEQNPEDWVEQTVAAMKELMARQPVLSKKVEGISFSGQMHGLVLLNESREVLRPAILWNDTRTTAQCTRITKKLGKQLQKITKNQALEGFTLPKLLWVKEHEPEIDQQIDMFLLPKDYVRFRLTGTVHIDYSDAAGTLLLNIGEQAWSKEICQAFDIPPHICPPLISSEEEVGTLFPHIARETGIEEGAKVFAGGADNACGAIGAGILSSGRTLCSIGTSGVILSYEEDHERELKGNLHLFYHAKKDAFYTMGVTLSAGYSLNWVKHLLAPEESFQSLLEGAVDVAPGANGLLFTPYLVGERTPHADSTIRGSLIGLDSRHERAHVVRAVLEGITFSLNESISLFRQAGKHIDSIVSIGGGARSRTWLQMQADIFQAEVIQLDNEQGPALGAAMLAAVGCGWYPSLETCADQFIHQAAVYEPEQQHASIYADLFHLYQKIYTQTRDIHAGLEQYRSV
ncbi:xylulokinase [Bacillus pumilus]|uniref:xylulokinase n=1 Tax=Bacillus pumilus TaxID=1408 RepID=UPI00227E374B|nr:xylulokinase [Bacillus pumilus]MCY7540155.1 xylulokinase [Bacillus pumilus]MEC3593789.1 xylulokinase [Bacillus pumilus]